MNTGTNEWAPSSVNVCLGCSHGCLYCYAADMAARFKRRRREEWDREVVCPDKVGKLRGKHFVGRVMFPTAHDWTAWTNEACGRALRWLIASGNDVLVVSKGGPDVAHGVYMGWYMAPRREGMGEPLRPELRMSITCMSEEVARFWEPGAALPVDRRGALVQAIGHGLPTSVSIEPLLEPDRAVELVEWVAPYCQADGQGRGGEIWIGRANQLVRRTAWASGRVDGLEEAVLRLEHEQRVGEVLRIYHSLREHPMVRWKDSYKAVLQRHGIEVTN